MIEEIRKHPALLLVLVALALSSAYGNYQYWLLQQHISTLAHQGANAHLVQCAIKSDLSQREINNEKFLKLTVRQRVEKYGKALGHIPESVIEQSIRGQKSTLDSLSRLRNCAPPQ